MKLRKEYNNILKTSIIIQSKDDCKMVLDLLKPLEKYINTLNENSYEYEEKCLYVVERFGEVLEFLYNGDSHHYNNNNLVVSDLITFEMWKYLKNKFSFETLIKKIDKLNNDYID